MTSLGALWKFSRPHTVIGTVIAILTLFTVICPNGKVEHLPLLGGVLTVAVCANLFIVGLNQLADVELDRINKPHLPLPSGELTRGAGWKIVLTALVLSLIISLWISLQFFLLISLAALIGWAYSMPPFHLKRHHISAALSITLVRGVLLNLCGFMVFNKMVNGSEELAPDVITLSVFVIIFSIVIAWFKDLPDVEGDGKHSIRSLAIVFSPATAVICGHVLIGSAYVFSIVRYAIGNDPDRMLRSNILFYSHILLLLLFLVNARSLDLKRHSSVRTFYRRFWWFFFAEYALYFAAYSLG